MRNEELPEYLKCPISLEIMVDPVILSSGHTFDRTSIQRWINSGHHTCPITKLPLPHPPSLIPNHALRSLISNYTPHHHLITPPPDDDYSLGLLISTLSSAGSSVEDKVECVERLAALTKSKRLAAESGAAASAVLRCVDSEDEELQGKALSLLLELSLDDDNKVGLVAEGAVGKVVAALGGRFASVAATVLTSLGVMEVNKATIGAYPDAIRSLVELIDKGKGRDRKEAATALFTICSFPENRRKAVECGAVVVLVRMAKRGLERAVEVLGLLAKCKQGREEMVVANDEEGIVEILVSYVKNGSSRGIQYGLLTLNLICCCCERIKLEVKNHGVLEICFGLIDDDNDCNDKICKVASSLIKVLQEE